MLVVLTDLAGMASWADIVVKGSCEGTPAVADSISDEEIAEAEELVRGNHLLISEESNPGCFSKWKYGLVGRFITGSQPVGVIKAALSFYWGRHRSFEILQASENAWLLLFEKEADMDWAMVNGPWAVCGRIIFLERWEPNFNFNSKVKTVVPVWLLLPDLPKKLLSRSAVIALAARVGRPLMLDSSSLAGDSRKCVRVKVSCDIAAPLLEGFNIVINGFSIWQRFRYAGFTRPCARCGLIGHTIATCASTRSEEPRGRSAVGRRRRKGSRGFSQAGRFETEKVVSEASEGTGLEGNGGGIGAEGEGEGLSYVAATQGINSEVPAGGLGLEGEIFVQLTGSVDASSPVREGTIGKGPVLGANPGAIPPRGGREECFKISSSRCNLTDSDSDDDPPPPKAMPAEQASSSKPREGKSCNVPVRETRRSKLCKEDSSAADFFRNAGAIEGVKAKASKASIGGRPGSEI